MMLYVLLHALWNQVQGNGRMFCTLLILTLITQAAEIVSELKKKKLKKLRLQYLPCHLD